MWYIFWACAALVAFNVAVVGWLFLRRRFVYAYQQKRYKELSEYCSKSSHTTNY